MITVKRRFYNTEEEDFAFSDGVKSAIKAMCKKFNIDESEVYENIKNKQNTIQNKDLLKVDKLSPQETEDKSIKSKENIE